MNKLLSPYRVGIEKSILYITFDRIVTADVFFANCADIQHILEDGAYNNQAFQQLYIDFSKTTWFDTLALCYMLMFTDCAKKRNNTLAIHFYFSETNGTEYHHQIFLAFLSDNGFLAQMEKMGKVYNYGIVPVLQYSQIHRCIWPLQIFYQPDEIGNNIDIIKKHLHDELSDTLNSYELENVTSKVTYFLQETVDNAFKHGYGGINAGGDEFHSRCTPCMLLIKRVKSCDTLDFKEYSVQYTEHTPYINIIVVVSQNFMGMTEASRTATAAILAFHPKIMMMAGICAGKKNETKLGDLIIADKAFDYSTGKLYETGLEHRPPHRPINDALASFVNNAWINQSDLIFAKINEKFSGDPLSGCKIRFTSMGSGPWVVDTEKVFEDIRDHVVGNCISLDMEAYAVALAADQLKTPWVIVKSVQDYADGKKSKTEKASRAYAAFSSAYLLCEYLPKMIEYIS